MNIIKTLRCLPVLFILFTGCEKEETLMEDEPPSCSVSEVVAPPVPGFDYFSGFKKEYYPDGRVKTLRTRRNLFSNGFSVDSLRYEFRYDDNLIQVVTFAQLFVGTTVPGNPDLLLEPNSSMWRLPFQIVLDEETGNALSAQYATFEYDNNRLVSVTSQGKKTVLEYDSKGNVTKVPGARYEYDVSKAATHQLYFSTSNEMFFLAEILGLIPVTSPHLRTKCTMISTPDDAGIETIIGSVDISNHKLNGDGLLISYEINSGSGAGTAENVWICAE